MSSSGVRQKDSLADVVELLLDKGIVINADIAVTIGETELLGIQLRAALASFETAAAYGLEFPEGTDMKRVAEAAGRPELAEEDDREILVEPPIREDRGDGDEADSADDGDGDGDGEKTEQTDDTEQAEQTDDADEIEAEEDDA